MRPSHLYSMGTMLESLIFPSFSGHSAACQRSQRPGCAHVADRVPPSHTSKGPMAPSDAISWTKEKKGCSGPGTFERMQLR